MIHPREGHDVWQNFLLITLFLISFCIWISISSVTANAAAELAKSASLFKFGYFGQISASTIVVGSVWTLFISQHLMRNLHIHPKKFFVNLLITAIWVSFLILATIIGISLLYRIGLASILVWAIELAVSARLFIFFTRPKLSVSSKFNAKLNATIAALSCSTFAKLLLLCVVPGIHIRF